MDLSHRRYGHAQQALILIPGLAAGHTSWRLTASALAAEHSVIAVDHRGAAQAGDHGSPCSIADMADDIAVLASRLGIRRFLLAGHSMGGAIAQSVAHRYPHRVQGLALCNSFVRLGEEARRFSEQILNLYRTGATSGEIAAAMLPRVFSTGFLTPQMLAVVKSDRDNRLFRQSEHDYQRQAAALKNFDSSAWAGSLRMPTLVVDSAEDHICGRADADRLAGLIRGARRITLSGGHASPLERPAELARALLCFFRPLLSQG